MELLASVVVFSDVGGCALNLGFQACNLVTKRLSLYVPALPFFLPTSLIGLSVCFTSCFVGLIRSFAFFSFYFDKFCSKKFSSSICACCCLIIDKRVIFVAIMHDGFHVELLTSV